MNDFQQEIYKTIDILTEEKLKQLGFDKTKRGKVISVSGTTCIVKINGENYTCKLRKGIHVQPNDVVFVKFPQNNDVDKYVDATLGNNEIPEYLVISAEEILTKLKTVDGEGSGLDADTLDGKHGSEFATKEDIEGISIDGDTIVQNINTSTSIIDDKNLSANVNDSISKKHDHSNKSILDTITQALIDGWNNAVAHISDKIKHITSSERALWNTVSNKSDKGHTHMESDITNLDKYTKAETDTKLGTKADKIYVDNELANKVDKITGKGLSTEDYTTAEKTKLSNIEDGAEKNKVDSVNSKTGDVVINKADIGLSNVENKSSATIRNEITKTNVTNALGYTPENSSNKGVANGYAPLDSNTKIPLSMLPDIAKQQTYVVETITDRDNLTGLIMGEKCYITTSGDSYIWDGTKWVTLAKADWENVNLQWTNIIGKPQSNVTDIDDAASKRHTHSNKSIIDTITQTLIDRWNSAWNHISDAIRHITSSERDKWNTVENKADIIYVDTELDKKVDKVTGKQLSTEDYTTIEKNKLANIEDGANKYILPSATATTLGGVKIGANLSITEDGVLSAIDDDNKNTFIIKQEVFVAEEGQTIFNLTKGHYQPNTHTISVYLYGGKQPNISFNEISTTAFEFTEPLGAGTVVLVEYIELSSATPYPIHGSDHLTGGYDPIPKATTASDGLMAKEDKIKLNTIEQGANKYIHPATHSLDMITETIDKKILTISERNKIAEIDNKVDKVSGKGLSDENYTLAEKNKLAGIEAGATKNDTDANLKNRANHTGQQPSSTISDFASTVRSTALTGLSTATSAAITATDTVLSALGKLQKQISDNLITLINHMNNKNNPHNVSKSDLNLDKVDNTSDLDKPISAAMQSALDKKVDNSRVLTDVPANAKFTDTIYTHPTTHPASMIVESTARRFVSDTEKANWNGKAEISDIPTKVGQLENDKNYVTQEDLGDAGYGDMLKSIYDTNSNGIVDRAEVADSVEWSNIQNKPSTFPPSNHNHDYIPLSGNVNIPGIKTFTDELKITGVENFDNIYIKKTLGSGQVGTTYANLPLEIKNGGYHRFWRISFPTGASFWGKVKITLLGGYSSFNASGQMAKEINVNFNTSNIYSNVGSYVELSGYVEKDFRISEAIWNTETSQWEFWIYSHQLQGNNVPYIFIEAWAKSLSYINHAKDITLEPQPLFLQDTTYQNVRGDAAGRTLTKIWSDLPTYQHPYGNTIAVIDDLPTKLSELQIDTPLIHRGTSAPSNRNIPWIDTSL